MAKKLAMVFGVVFVLIGLLGFFNDPVLGVFAVNGIHNIVHVLLGLILIWGSKGDAAKVLKIIAIVYFLVAILGFVLSPADGMLLGLVEVNTADNWLHLVLAVVLFLSSMGGKPMMMSKPPSMPNMSA